MKRLFALMIISLIVFSSFSVFDLKAQEVRLGLPLGHTSCLLSAQFSPDGKYIVTASWDDNAKIWDAGSGKLIHSLEGHASWVISAQYSPDGKYIVTASLDGTAKIWDAYSGKLLHSLGEPANNIESAQFSPDGKCIVTACKDHTAKIWDAYSGKLLHSLEGHTGYAIFAQYSPDGKYIVTASYDNRAKYWDWWDRSAEIWDASSSWNSNRIYEVTRDNTAKIWDADSGKLLHSIDLYFSCFVNYRNHVTSVQYSPDRKYIITTAFGDSTAIVWQADSSNVLFRLEGHKEWVFSAQYSPDGKYIVTVSADSTVKIWEAGNGKLLHSLKRPSDAVISAQYSPDGKYIVTASSGSTVNIWDAGSGSLLQSLEGHSNTVYSAQYSPDGNYIVTASMDGTAKIWDAGSGKLIHSLEGHINRIYSAQYRPDGKCIVTTSDDNTAKIWDEGCGKLLHTLEGHTDYIFSAQYSPDGNYIVTVSFDSTVKIWEAGNGKLLHSFMRHSDLVNSAQYSPDGKYIVTASWDGTAKIWDADSGKLIHSLEGHKNRIYSAQYSPDGKYIVTSSEDSTAKIWNASNGKLIHTLKGHTYIVRKARFSPNGKYIVTASLDGTAKIWDAGSGKLIHNLEDSNSIGIILFAEYSPDGKHIITGLDDYSNTSQIWDANKGKLLHSLKGHTGTVYYAQFSPNGKYAVTASNDMTAKIWDAGSGRLLHSLEGHSDAVNSAQYSPDGNYIVTASMDGTAIIWDAQTGKIIVRQLSIDKNNFLNLTYDNYYYGTKKAVALLYWIVDNTKIYPFEQFDLQYNRPDIVLERIGLADTSLINAYRKAYYKRLKKMKFEEGMFSPEFHMPETGLLNKDNIPINTNEEKLGLNISVSDSKYKLDQFNIWINNVPLYGINGISLLSFHTDSIVKNISVPLSVGKNNIQISCLNEKGVESLKESLEILYEPEEETKPDLYVIALSANRYKQSQFNLAYAVNDGKSLADAFASEKANYSHIYIDTIFNENATCENVLKLKEKLLKSNVDDHVILFISGHGLLDDNLDFYFATHDVDFYNPTERGLSYDALENLLDSIPARNKLLMMDACHSGDVDKSELEEINDTIVLADGSRKGLKTYSYKKREGDNQQQLSLQNSFELMQELFANLSKGSGAVVISAAAGNGYALEYDKIEHGIFTYCVLEALKDNTADANKDEQITVNELKDYVSKRVEYYTNGKQKPTSRRENLEFDFRVW